MAMKSLVSPTVAIPNQLMLSQTPSERTSYELAAAEDELPTGSKDAAEDELTIPLYAETEHRNDAALMPIPLEAEIEHSDDAALEPIPF